MYDVAVIGAGLCGLTAAYTLTQQGYRVLLLEGSERVGGVIQSVEEAGFLLEAGPTTFQSTAHDLLALARQLGLEPVAASPLAKKRYVYLHQQLTPLPDNPWAFFTSPVLSWRAKLRLLQEPWLSSEASGGDETVADWVRRRLGSEVLDNLVGPFISGVYAGDPEALSLASAFPRLAQWEQESGSVFRGMLAARRQAKQRASQRTPYRLMSFHEGMGALPKALAEALPEGCLRLMSPVERLNPELEGYGIQLQDGECLAARAVVLATPAGIAASVMETFMPQGAGLLREIPYVPLSVVHFGFLRQAIAHALDGFGFLVPRKAGISTLGSIWVSRLFPERPPEGTVLCSSFLGGALPLREGSLSLEAAEQQVLKDLRVLLQEPALSPVFSRAFYYPAAIPQYTVGHGARLDRLNALLTERPGLFLTGNYLSGVSLQDCVQSAQQVVSRVQAYLRHPGSGVV